MNKKMNDSINPESEKVRPPSLLDRMIKVYFRTKPEETEINYRQNPHKDLRNPIIKALIMELKLEPFLIFLEPERIYTLLSLTPAYVKPDRLPEDESKWPPDLHEVLKINWRKNPMRTNFPLKGALLSISKWVARKEQEIKQ